MRRARQAGLGLALLVLAAMPIGAGATGHGPLAMLAFAGLFLLANAVIRPASVSLGGLAAQAMTAAAFAALLVGLGQSARPLAGIEAETGLFGWVFAGAWAAVLARIVWPPRLSDRLAGGAEGALREVHRRGEAARAGRAPAGRKSGTRAEAAVGGVAGEPSDPAPPTAPSPPDGQATPPRSDAGPAPGRSPGRSPDRSPDAAPATGLDRLDALPADGTTDEDLRGALEALNAAAPPESVIAALLDRSSPDGPERDRRALALQVTDPWVLAQRQGEGDPAAAFEAIVAAADAASLGALLSHALAVLDVMPEARADMPEIGRLLEISDQIDAAHEAEAELLVTLAHRIEDLALEAENGADA